jgi:Fe-S cluster assembly protein SufD
VTVTETPAVADAIETTSVSSHLHPAGSFSVDDHPVPTGREEIWRFTPLKRLRGLHQDVSLGGTSYAADVQAPEGVVVERLGARRCRCASRPRPSSTSRSSSP